MSSVLWHEHYSACRPLSDAVRLLLKNARAASGGDAPVSFVALQPSFSSVLVQLLSGERSKLRPCGLPVLVSLCAAIKDFLALYVTHPESFSPEYNASEDMVSCGIMAVR